MKRYVALLLLGLFGLGISTATVRAQIAPSSSLTLDVKTVAHGTGGSTTQTGYYSQSRSYSSTTALAIKVGNLGHDIANGEVEWFFIGKPMKGGQRRFIYDQGSKALELAPGKWAENEAESKPLEGVKESGYYYRYESGSKSDGWIVRLKENGKVVRIKASSPAYEAIAKSDEELAKLSAREEQ